MQVVSLDPEIRWMPQWSVDKQVTTSIGGPEKKNIKRRNSSKREVNADRFSYSFFTHVSDVLSYSLALDQRGDPKAVVPVSTTEEQLSVVGDDKQACC